MHFSDLLHKHFKALYVSWAPLLVADCEVLHSEWLRVAHLCSYLTPLGVRTSVCKLDKVDCILDVRSELLYRHNLSALELAGHSAADHWKRSSSEILCKEEHLIESHSCALEIVRSSPVLEDVVPSVFIKRTVLHWTNTLLPFVSGVKAVSFDDTAARESEESRLQVIQRLGKVLPEAVFPAFPGVHREKGYMVELHCSLALKQDSELAVGICERSSHIYGDLVPAFALHVHIYPIISVISVRSHQFRLQCHRPVLVGPYVRRKAVLLARLKADAPISFIVDSGPEPSSIVGNTHVMRVSVKARVFVLNADQTERCPAYEAVRELERTVLHELGIKSAVGSEVDVLEEYTVHFRRYILAGSLHIHAEMVGRCLCCRAKADC